MSRKLKKSNNSDSEKEFEILLHEFLDGERRIEALLLHPEFVNRSLKICRVLTGSQDDAEDLFQDVCLRMLKYGHNLTRAKIPDKRAFFAWLSKLTHNVFLDSVRRRRLLTDALPLENVTLPDPAVSRDREDLKEEFVRLIGSLPLERRIAMEMWLDGHSFRKISAQLRTLGFVTSHVTVATWLKSVLKVLISHVTVPEDSQNPIHSSARTPS